MSSIEDQINYDLGGGSSIMGGNLIHTIDD